jgi:hypothetical protein
MKNLAFEAILTLYPPSVSGRVASITHGYRPMFDLGEAAPSPGFYDAQIDLIDREWLEPGRRARVTITPGRPDLWKRARPGSTIRFQEGARVIGEASLAGPVQAR